MKKFLIVCFLMLICNSAFAQYPIFYWQPVGTPASCYLQGMAMATAAGGYWNEHTAIAMMYYQDALDKSLDNRKKAVDTYFALKTTNRSYRDSIKRKPYKAPLHANPSFVYNGKDFGSYQNFKKSPEFALMKNKTLEHEIEKQNQLMTDGERYQNVLTNLKEYRERSYYKKNQYRNIDRTRELLGE